MLLSRGEMAYFGGAAEMVSHFSKIGFECPIYSNPADFAGILTHSKNFLRI
jgi:hypothetical protein